MNLLQIVKSQHRTPALLRFFGGAAHYGFSIFVNIFYIFVNARLTDQAAHWLRAALGQLQCGFSSAEIEL